MEIRFSGRLIDRRRPRQFPWTSRLVHKVRRGQFRPLRFGIELLEDRRMLDAGPLYISEFMAVNDSTLADEDGDYSDWIEIQNPGNTTVDLDGWYLTDNEAELTKWQFPRVTLAPDERLLVFASDKDRADPLGELHTNFKLSGDGEYLALVRADGSTISHEYAPEYPQQHADVSYGITLDVATFSVPDSAAVTYLVPTAAQQPLVATWTERAFDDSSWNRYSQAGGIRITEAGTESPYVEIQNVSQTAIDTSGWAVAVNNGSAFNINDVHATFWELPETMDAGELLYRNSDPDDLDYFWGESILWWTSGPAWVLLLDATGSVVDFVVWGYTEPQIASFNVTAGGHSITAADLPWTGASVTAAGNGDNSLQRRGGSDHDNALDWAFVVPQSPRNSNAGLTMPFTTDIATGIGFDAASTCVGAVVQVDIETAMYGRNGSLWARYPFVVEDPLELDAMQLRLKYNDGFVAYLNGVRVAGDNAPDTPLWNSTATAGRTVVESLEYAQFDVSEYVPELQPGVNVLAIQGLNRAADDPDFLVLPDLVHHARRYFGDPTPGEENTPGFVDFVKDTKFSVDRGYYDAPFDLEITTGTTGATIRYTLDGSEPTPTRGTLYTGPIHVSRTTTLRAFAFKEDMEPSDVDTQTYVFLDRVLQQTNVAPAGAHWDTAMDPQVVNNTTQTYSVREGLVDLPTMSIVMSDTDLFGSNGIYQNPLSRGEAWIRPGSVEFFYPEQYDGYRVGDGFAVNAGVRIAGIYSRYTSNPKHSFRLSFQARFGPSKLDFPLFEDSPMTRFDNLAVINGHNQSWASNHANALYLRDQVARDLQQLEPDHTHVNGTFVNLYLNGLYWGQYNLVERPDDSFAAENFGGDKEEYDVFKGVRHGETPLAMLVKGTRDAWNAMFAIADRNMTDPANYEAIQQYVDVVQLIDYNIGIIYTADRDGPTGIVAGQSTPKNFYALRRRDDSGRFRFFPWDAEFTFEQVNTDVSERMGTENPARLHYKLRANPEYRLLFADRVHKWFFNDGPLMPHNVAEQFSERAAEIDRSIVAESARWGDAKREPPYTRDAEWANELARVLNSVIPGRSGVVLNQFRADGLYPDVDAPEFHVNGLPQHGGFVSPGDRLTMSAPGGMVFYTRDGSDPRLPGGGMSPGAEQYTGGSTTPLVLSGATWKYFDKGSEPAANWFAADYVDDDWQSGPAEFGYGDNDEETVVDYGGDSANRYVTTYFRHTFHVDDPAEFSGLTFKLLRDDGAVVYLNGQALPWHADYNMPDGQIDYQTRPSS
ncbi:MAG: CotH kinase family protein, partial [Candidatus Nealsonbacteria bacterium]|nr:CotH kinase family protein [Candidatus Nealsonbacteria bacterium]